MCLLLTQHPRHMSLLSLWCCERVVAVTARALRVIQARQDKYTGTKRDLRRNWASMAASSTLNKQLKAEIAKA